MQRLRSGHRHCVINRVAFSLSHHPYPSPPSSTPLRLSSPHPTPQTSISLQTRTITIHSSSSVLRRPLPSSYSSSSSPPKGTRNMSSDDAYMSFLDKANSDLNTARTTQAASSSRARTETVDVDVRVPAPLVAIDAFYVSETDEPFEPVALKWDGAKRGIWPDSVNLSSLVSPDTDLSDNISTLSTSAFDPRNHYPGVFKNVRAAAVEASAGGDESAVEVKVYRVEVGTSRVDYFVVALGLQEGLLVGVRAKAVES